MTQDWNEASLDTVLDRLSQISGTPFSASTKARSGAFADASISAQLDDVAVGDVLDVVVTGPLGLWWFVRDGGIVVATYAELPDGPLLRYRGVQDILRDMTMQHGYEGPEAMRRLVRDLKREVLGAQRAAPVGSVMGRNGVLAVRATKGVHITVDRALDEVRSRYRPDIASFHAR